MTRRAAVTRLVVVTGALVAVAVAVLVWSPVSGADVRHAVRSFGPLAPLAYVVVAAGLGMVFVPGPLLSAASGALFGVWLGFGVSTASAVLGAAVSTLLGARVGAAPMAAVSGERATALADLARRRGLLVVIVQRWVPGVPDQPFSYLFGVLGLRIRTVAIGTAIGSAPRAFAYTALGDAATTRDATLAAVAIGVGLVVSVVGSVVGAVVVRRSRRRPAPVGRHEH